MEFLKEDIASKLANMKKAISYSSDFMKSIDLDNATYEKEGLKMLESFNPDSGMKLVTSSSNSPRSSVSASTPSGDYGDLLR